MTESILPGAERDRHALPHASAGDGKAAGSRAALRGSQGREPVSGGSAVTGLKPPGAEEALSDHLAAMAKLRQPQPRPATSTPAGAPDPAARIAAWLLTGIYERVFDDAYQGWLIAGDEYELPSEEQYRELGEDPGDSGCPLILRRKRDGRFFEVELDAAVWETSAETRRKQRERFADVRAANARGNP